MRPVGVHEVDFPIAAVARRCEDDPPAVRRPLRPGILVAAVRGAAGKLEPDHACRDDVHRSPPRFAYIREAAPAVAPPSAKEIPRIERPRGASARARLPAKPLERDPALAVEPDALLLQTRALNVVVGTVGALSNSTLRVHDAMPRKPGSLRQRRERVTDDARLS